jgi:transporter family-2 protein
MVSSVGSPSKRYLIALVASVIAGVLVAVQSRINGEFGLALGDGALAALLSFSTGLLVTTIAVLINPQARRGLGRIREALVAGELPWWGAIGGAGGAFLVLTQGLSAGVLGVALFTIAVVSGQTLGALVIDTRGWVGVPRVPLNRWRVVGALLVLAGVVLALDVRPGDSFELGALFVLPLVAGAGTGFQQAVNGRVRAVAVSSISATFLNFAVGTTVLALVFLVSVPFTGGPTAFPGTWWLWLGGIVGAFFIAIQVTTVSIIGVLGLGVSLVTGQLFGSIVLEATMPVATSDLHLATVVGALITLAGSAMVTLSRKS